MIFFQIIIIQCYNNTTDNTGTPTQPRGKNWRWIPS